MFHSFVQKFRPGANDLSRSVGSSITSTPSPSPATIVQRNASAPYCRTTSSGSMPFPSDLDIFRCCMSRTVPCRYTVWYGVSPRNQHPAMTMRETQKNRISGAVTSTSPG